MSSTRGFRKRNDAMKAQEPR